MAIRHINKKKITLLISAIVLVGLAAAGGVYWKQQQAQQSASDAKQLNQAKVAVEKLNINGDDSLAAQYVAKLLRKDMDGADAIFASKVQSTNEIEQKLALCQQQMLLALSYQLPDEALKPALRALEVTKTHVTHSNVAQVYGVKRDYPMQIEHLTKATDLARSTPATQQYVAIYESQIEAAKEMKVVQDKYDKQ